MISIKNTWNTYPATALCAEHGRAMGWRKNNVIWTIRKLKSAD
jgi:hypothetical protein